MRGALTNIISNLYILLDGLVHGRDQLPDLTDDDYDYLAGNGYDISTSI